jgi:RNA polymerase sigma-70 factor (ECF subfamily)
VDQQRREFEERLLPLRDCAFNLAVWLVSSRADAEDVVQDAYVRAWRAYGTVRGPSVKAWLLTIVRNTAYRHLHNRSRQSNVVSLDDAWRGSERADGPALREPASDADDAEACLIRSDERDALMAALATLPVALRETIVLREMEDLSYREIADVMATPVGTVMSRLHRARADLRKALAGPGKERHRAV